MDRKEYMKEYYIKNKEKLKQQKSEYYQNNKEIFLERNRRFWETLAGKKLRTINNWKYKGLISKDYETLYNNYLACTACQVCNKDFKSTKDRCMDHDHDTGLFRQFLCQCCNVRDNWKNKI